MPKVITYLGKVPKRAQGEEIPRYFVGVNRLRTNVGNAFFPRMGDITFWPGLEVDGGWFVETRLVYYIEFDTDFI